MATIRPERGDRQSRPRRRELGQAPAAAPAATILAKRDRVLGRTNGRRRSWALTATILVLIPFNLAASYGMNLWNREIFDALDKHDAGRVLFISLVYFPLLAVSVCVAVAQVYARVRGLP